MLWAEKLTGGVAGIELMMRLISEGVTSEKFCGGKEKVNIWNQADLAPPQYMA